ncbi:competence protein ComK [Tenuibacillus multivorans]|uniref:Competence protein ComK n=1 Tax=Tenuibacillus multivorans TaxID=237069 RepID=A0A1H0A3R1_9BACI|nr:competence protein ComK [Tenuibacillus multivorans]GEL78365.1 hypothetical protein TMU01_26000 [Tenuibacillus multivorans]SDN27603.1 competence protein ComK [Tenuibacillus multivorans]
MKLINRPRVTAKTMAVLPYELDEDTCGSQVLERDGEYYTYLSPRQVMDEVCKELGADLKGRLRGAQHVYGINRKAPIAIDTSCQIFFLPTSSPSANDCIWICHNHVSYVKKVTPKVTQIHFNNGKQIKLNISYLSISNQIQRTAQYRHLLMERVNKLQKEIERELLELQP